MLRRDRFHGDLIAHWPPVFIQSGDWFQESSRAQTLRVPCGSVPFLWRHLKWVCLTLLCVDYSRAGRITRSYRTCVCVCLCGHGWSERWCWQPVSFSLNFADSHFFRSVGERDYLVEFRVCWGCGRLRGMLVSVCDYSNETWSFENKPWVDDDNNNDDDDEAKCLLCKQY